MKGMDRSDLIAKLSQMDGTTEVVDALVDWFDTPRCEADWSSKNGIAGIIEKVAMGDMPKTILSDWGLYSEWAKARTVNVFDWKHFNVADWLWYVVCCAVDMRWCVQGSPKRWAKDVYDVSTGRYGDDRIANPMMLCWCCLYGLVVIPDLRKVVPSMDMAQQMKAARMLQFVRDNGEVIVECIMGYHIDLREWCSCDGVGMVPKDCYERVKQVYDINAMAEVQQRAYHDDAYVHQHKLELERKYQAKKKIANNWIG